MRTRFVQAALAALALTVASCRESTAPTPGPLAHADIVSGDLQTAAAGTQLAAPLVVKVTDADGHPLAGQVVNFVVSSGGGSLFAPTAQSNADGVAQNLWTLGTTVGTMQKVEIRAVDATTGAPITYATFSATVTAGPAAQVQKLSGDAQSGSIGAPLPDSLQVKVVDRYGNAVPNAAVTWTATDGGSMGPATSTTRADGTARALWTIGTHASATAAVGVPTGTPAGFTAFASVSPLTGAVVTKVSGDGQTVAVGATLPQPLTVRVTLADGRPIDGARVYFETIGIVVTSPDGVAQATPGAVPTPGTRTIHAGFLGDAPGTWIGSPVSFTTTSVTGPPAIVVIQGKGFNGHLTAQSNAWLPGTAIRYTDMSAGPHLEPVDSLRVLVTDAYANPVAGATVVWSSSSGAVRPASAVTAANGMAATHFVAGLGFTKVFATVGAVVDSANTSPFSSSGASLVVGAGTLSLAAGADAPVVVQVQSAVNGPFDVDSDYLTWTSSNPAVATATTGAPGSPARATITGHAAGAATLTAAIGTTTGTITVTVTP